MNILSLFDGIATARIALEKVNIKVNNYFSSEIDKYAIKIAKKNYPDIIELGNINNWKEWNLPKIDLIIGGSPCQGFSKAGLGLNFDDNRSQLFFQFADILKFLKPTFFLLENVRMKEEWRNIISEHLGMNPILIDSNLLSAQDRKRFYWTNIPGIFQPKDKNVLLKDIIINGIPERNKAYTIDANYHKGGTLKNHRLKEFRKLRESERRMIIKINNTWRKLFPLECERLQNLPDGYTEGISDTQRYKCIGNSFETDTIAHILSFLPIDNYK